MLDCFNPYPFERLRALVAGIEPEISGANLTIGEPKFDTPALIQNALKDTTNLLNKYPKSAGEDALKDAQIKFVESRFGVRLAREQIIPTFGTREVLFNFPQFYLWESNNSSTKTIAFPNPFYQIYEGAAIGAKANIIYMELNAQNNFTPKLESADLDRVDLLILNSPNNPTGRALSKDELIEWVKLSAKHNFLLLNDECYSEIYEDSPPCGILEAAMAAGNTDFKNIISLNSISKRNSAPGLRSGFIAGDGAILKKYNLYRTYLGNALPLPLQAASAAAWSDFESAEFFRKKYARNLALAREILGVEVAPYTFYVWLDVNGDELEFTKNLYKKSGILVLPGSFLGRKNAGAGFVRIALVEESEVIESALKSIKNFIDSKKAH